jgi:hypothetical protein
VSEPFPRKHNWLAALRAIKSAAGKASRIKGDLTLVRSLDLVWSAATYPAMGPFNIYQIQIDELELIATKRFEDCLKQLGISGHTLITNGLAGASDPSRLTTGCGSDRGQHCLPNRVTAHPSQKRRRDGRQKGTSFSSYGSSGVNVSAALRQACLMSVIAAPEPTVDLLEGLPILMVSFHDICYVPTNIVTGARHVANSTSFAVSCSAYDRWSERSFRLPAGTRQLFGVFHEKDITRNCHLRLVSDDSSSSDREKRNHWNVVWQLGA